MVRKRQARLGRRLRGRRACHAVVALGGNLGDVPAAFAAALALIDCAHTRVVVVSRLYHSLALEMPGCRAAAGAAPPAGHFTNAACCVRTRLGPRQLLLHLQRIEHMLGRRRGLRWGPRTIDLDLICYEQKIMQRSTLTLPHKGLPFRAFVLAPLRDMGIEQPWPHLLQKVSELLSVGLDAELGLLHRRLSWLAK